MSFVDDEEDETTSARQVRKGSVELREKTEEAEGGLGLELEEDLTVKGDDSEVRIGEIDDGIDVAVEGVGKGAESSRLASADITGDQRRETLLQGEGQAALSFAVTARRIEVIAVNRFGERRGGKAVKVIECGHCCLSPVSR
jgi:hypothetical protein